MRWLSCFPDAITVTWLTPTYASESLRKWPTSTAVCRREPIKVLECSEQSPPSRRSLMMNHHCRRRRCLLLLLALLLFLPGIAFPIEQEKTEEKKEPPHDSQIVTRHS